MTTSASSRRAVCNSSNKRLLPASTATEEVAGVANKIESSKSTRSLSPKMDDLAKAATAILSQNSSSRRMATRSSQSNNNKRQKLDHDDKKPASTKETKAVAAPPPKRISYTQQYLDQQTKPRKTVCTATNMVQRRQRPSNNKSNKAESEQSILAFARLIF